MANLTTDLASMIDVVKSCMGLLTEFPLNLILVSTLAGVGFGIFGKAKAAAH